MNPKVNQNIDNVYTSDRIKMAKDKQINIRFSVEDKKLIEKDAKDQQRSISNLLIWCWKEWRKTKGKK